jgi:hypothetical protein
MMGSSFELIQQFFRDFERNNNVGDWDASVAQFADVFMAAGPDGATTVHSSDFALALPKRKQYFDRLGCRSTTLETLSETRLDDRYSLVETQWRLVLASTGRPVKDVLLGSSFIIDRATEPLKIVFYLAHHDIAVVLKERGMFPA